MCDPIHVVPTAHHQKTESGLKSSVIRTEPRTHSYVPESTVSKHLEHRYPDRYYKCMSNTEKADYISHGRASTCSPGASSTSESLRSGNVQNRHRSGGRVEVFVHTYVSLHNPRCLCVAIRAFSNLQRINVFICLIRNKSGCIMQ